MDFLTSFFQLKDLVFLGVCLIGMVVHAIIAGGIDKSDLVFVGMCCVLIVVYNIIRVVGY